MKLLLVTPSLPRFASGNLVTAQRWEGILRSLGHDVAVIDEWDGQPADGIVALHARKTSESIRRFRESHPGGHIIVTMTGTDVYGDLPSDELALQSLAAADRIIALQEHAARELSKEYRNKVRVIHQSIEAPSNPPEPRPDRFQVCVLANLREVKDPLLAARALNHLPSESGIHVVLAGGDLDPDLSQQARELTRQNSRFEWRGELERTQALNLLGESRLLVSSSRLEGGANVVSEAIVYGVPVLATRIQGSLGLLGNDYPGYFEVGDAPGLAELMRRAETDARFLASLTEQGARRRPLFLPARERQCWRNLLQELA